MTLNAVIATDTKDPAHWAESGVVLSLAVSIRSAGA
jgi:hypothetical protein